MSTILHSHVLQSMPARAALVGSRRLCAVVDAVVREWPAPALPQGAYGTATKDHIVRLVEKRVWSSKQYGFLWTIVLGAVLSSVVRVILEWWLMKPSHQSLMMQWQGGGR